MPVSRQAGWIDPFLAKSGPLRKSTLLYSLISILKYYFDFKDFTRKKLFIQEMLAPPTHHDILARVSVLNSFLSFWSWPKNNTAHCGNFDGKIYTWSWPSILFYLPWWMVFSPCQSVPAPKIENVLFRSQFCATTFFVRLFYTGTLSWAKIWYPWCWHISSSAIFFRQQLLQHVTCAWRGSQPRWW